ncbi:Transcription factor tau subunit sfc4 OS=Schizosaccharomyces pombe (strain 972 / ATCC 24843) GN=sfc4 PE=1 SV=1 [Rhizoctonia solani AG-1 IB]|uniref:Transcription factor tau subunit sfc4 n=1 Tax=Thanatephorus cucumeris (strain AG1-IB / isolate 7/3/14) TaxID=1108050 RepID=A0A0B7FCS2_THACB|nr:Transcription factor tau subunit sfc4 OS=Schizosaccharomyces pombe (strain 972 / ATCC 24843) GN=sfc4 PE=1 SV=1 [Rhizoctonia solani AG-1 IB]
MRGKRVGDASEGRSAVRTRKGLLNRTLVTTVDTPAGSKNGLDSYGRIQEHPGTATLLQRAMQRQADNRNHMVTQGFAFLSKYRAIRGSEGPLNTEEVDYNLGRGFQQLGLQAFAQKHYQAVLESVEKRQKVDPNAPLGIARETAYNLSLIYVVSGSARLAQDLYRRWLSL